MPQRTITRRELIAGLAVGSGTALLGLAGCSRSQNAVISRGEDLTMLDLSEASNAVRVKDVSPVELTKACLERIGRLDGKLNSFITVMPEIALQQARSAEEAITKGGWQGPLHGIPIAVKDNIARRAFGLRRQVLCFLIACRREMLR
ncbi:MAG: hypothetical protein KIT61_02725 [Pyrinomonadaceae bacterium]|nr:hypothetical protein [Pyrinomonadaceae bacterium]